MKALQASPLTPAFPCPPIADLQLRPEAQGRGPRAFHQRAAVSRGGETRHRGDWEPGESPGAPFYLPSSIRSHPSRSDPLSSVPVPPLPVPSLLSPYLPFPYLPLSCLPLALQSSSFTPLSNGCLLTLHRLQRMTGGRIPPRAGRSARAPLYPRPSPCFRSRQVQMQAAARISALSGLRSVPSGSEGEEEQEDCSQGGTSAMRHKRRLRIRCHVSRMLPPVRRMARRKRMGAAGIRRGIRGPMAAAVRRSEACLRGWRRPCAAATAVAAARVRGALQGEGASTKSIMSTATITTSRHPLFIPWNSSTAAAAAAGEKCLPGWPVRFDFESLILCGSKKTERRLMFPG